MHKALHFRSKLRVRRLFAADGTVGVGVTSSTCVNLPQEEQKGPVCLENWGAGSFEKHHSCKVNKHQL